MEKNSKKKKKTFVLWKVKILNYIILDFLCVEFRGLFKIKSIKTIFNVSFMPILFYFYKFNVVIFVKNIFIILLKRMNR